MALAAPGHDGKPDTVQVWDVAGRGTTILEAPLLKRPVSATAPRVEAFLSNDGKRVALYRSFRPNGGFGIPPEKSEPEDSPPKSDVTVWDVASKTELFHIELLSGASAASPA